MTSPKYLVKYGPETIDSAATLADARQKRRDLIASGAPRTLHITRPLDQKRWY